MHEFFSQIEQPTVKKKVLCAVNEGSDLPSFKRTFYGVLKQIGLKISTRGRNMYLLEDDVPPILMLIEMTSLFGGGNI